MAMFGLRMARIVDAVGVMIFFILNVSTHPHLPYVSMLLYNAVLSHLTCVINHVLYSVS